MAMIPWWIHYPNVNNEIINLDWLLQVTNENSLKIENFIGVNTIKYADPILWDITKQYEANTIVVDPSTGDAYISTEAVPYGVALSNDNYWTRIYNYASEIHTFRDQIAADEQLSTTASAPRVVDDLVFLNGLLYRVTAPMIAGDSYVVDSNCVKTTINAELLRLHTSISAEAEARADADTALGGRIDDEAQARADADTALGGRIDDEAEARADADTALGGRIDGEAEARAEADTALGGRIDAIGQRIDDISSELKYHKIVTIGDSYSLSTDGDGVLLPVGYISMIKNVTTHVNLSAGGSSFYNTSIYPTFLAQLQNAESGTTISDGTNSLEKTEVTDIIVVGGFNDLPTVWGGTQAQLLSAIASFMTYATTNYPNAKIHVGMIGGSTIATHYVGFAKIIEAYKSCIQYGGIYLNGVENVLSWESTLQSDGIHPSTLGVSLLETAIAGAFKSGSYQFNLAGLAAAVTFTVNSNIFSSGTINIQQKQHNDLVDTQINPNGLSTILTLSSTLTLTVVRTQIDLGTLSNLVVKGNTDGTTNLNINIMVYDTTTSAWIYLPAQLTLIDSELYLEISSGIAYDINQIIIGSGQTTLFIKNPLV